MNEQPIYEFRFILDVHLGKLAKSLRLFGFDAYLDFTLNDNEIISFALSDKRIILTRDKELLNHKNINHGYRILSQKPGEQLKEVFSHFDLKNRINPFTRCMECNGVLEVIPKEEIIDRLFPRTIEYYTDFKRCNDCSRIYWEGSHFERMRKYVFSVIKDVN